MKKGVILPTVLPCMYYFQKCNKYGKVPSEKFYPEKNCCLGLKDAVAAALSEPGYKFQKGSSTKL